MHNQEAVWGFNGTAAQNQTTVRLPDQAKLIEAEKQSLWNTINICARNQIIHKMFAQSLDPDFMATLVNSKENREHLVLKDSDNGDYEASILLALTYAYSIAYVGFNMFFLLLARLKLIIGSRHIQSF